MTQPPRSPPEFALVSSTSRSPLLSVLSLVTLLGAVACGGDDKNGKDAGDPKAAPGVVTGTVVDFAGKPLAGAEISVYGTAIESGEDVGVYPKTDAAGVYEVEVPDGQYQVSGTYDVTFGEDIFRYTLEPTDGEAGLDYPSKEGIRRDFVLKVSGLRAGYERSDDAGYAYYGAEVQMDISDVKNESFQTNHFATEFPQGFTTEVTFTPEAPLIDGSTAEVVVTTSPKVTSKFDAAWEHLDLPVGKWRVAGKIVRPDGSSKALQVVMPDNTLAESKELTFQPESGITGGVRPTGVTFVYGAPYPPLF